MLATKKYNKKCNQKIFSENRCVKYFIVCNAFTSCLIGGKLLQKFSPKSPFKTLKYW